jgi:spore coat polysaccharide biosynthesis predicted glycosyltransferase SpsG
MSVPLDVVIRADAGHAMGTGHFGRASAVAKALGAYRDLRVVLLTLDSSLPLVGAYFPETLKVVTLASDSSAPASALDVLVAAGVRPAALYFDHYGEVRDWEAATSAAGIPMLVLDDLCEAKAAAAIVRVMTGMSGAPGFAGSLTLEGPGWFPVSDHVARHRERPETRRPAEFRINICFGGSDPTRETLKALEAVSTIQGVLVDVVIGPGTDFTQADLAPFGDLPHVRLHRAPDQAHLAALLAEADLALGAGGVMLWERMCLGVPSLAVQVADNQQAQIDWAQGQGALHSLGQHGAVTPDMIRASIDALRTDEAARRSLAQAGATLVDGRGALRLAAVLRGLCLSARPVHVSDARDLYNWRTDGRNWRFNWSDDDKPTYSAHCGWLTRRLADPNCLFLIVRQGDDPIGVVRFDRDATGQAALSIYLVPEQHGRKLGLPVYMAAERALRSRQPGVSAITSRIHTDNAASRRLHEDAGFTLSGDRDRWLVARKVL